MSCMHRTAADFIARKDGDLHIWRCSGCGEQFTWDEASEYLGSLECKICRQPDIEAVVCSPECEKRVRAGQEAPFFTGKPGWEWHSTNSSNIAGVGYDADHELAAVKFHNGTIYDYDNVPIEAAEEMVRALSVGSHFNKIFRQKYHGTRRGAGPAASVLPGGAR